MATHNLTCRLPIMRATSPCRLSNKEICKICAHIAWPSSGTVHEPIRTSAQATGAMNAQQRADGQDQCQMTNALRHHRLLSSSTHS